MGNLSKGLYAISTIIIVDDEPTVLSALTLLLQAIGYRVHGFNRGTDLFDALANGTSGDFLLCDLKMPEINGLSLLAKVRDVAPTIPFALMSAHATKAEINAASELGAVGFLAKPFSPEELNNLINCIQRTPVRVAV